MNVLVAYRFTAILSLLPTENGGRKKPVYDHYRPSFSFNTANQISGEISFPEQDELKPGDTSRALIKLLPAKHIRRNLKVGDSFTILEGEKIVGIGIIEQVQKKELVTSS